MTNKLLVLVFRAIQGVRQLQLFLAVHLVQVILGSRLRLFGLDILVDRVATPIELVHLSVLVNQEYHPFLVVPEGRVFLARQAFRHLQEHLVHRVYPGDLVHLGVQANLDNRQHL